MTWKLKTRLDAMPSMIVHDAQVTGWVRNRTLRNYRGQEDAEVMAVAQVDNSSMTIRALVGPDDLNAVVTKPVIVRRSVIPDTVTDRRILMADPKNVTVQIDAVDATNNYEDLACDHLGLTRGLPLDFSALVPAVKGEMVVRRSASILLSYPQPIWRYQSGASSPDGIIGKLLGDDDDHKARLMLFYTCGGFVFGKVPKSDFLGRPVTGRFTGGACPNTGEGTPHLYHVAGDVFDKLVACSRDIPVFIRTMTLEDLIGSLKAGTRVRLDGKVQGGTELIAVPNAPAMPLGSARFSVRTSDLASCAAVEGDLTRAR